MTTFNIITADVIDGLASLPDESVNCVVTSPPYWGLRDYGTGVWIDGDAGCDHLGKPMAMGQFCTRCGAIRIDKQLGLEATPEEYTAKMVEVFREVRRVLKKDGTLWLNLGDSYASDPTKGYGSPDGKNKNAGSQRARYIGDGIKPKDRMGIPWLVAFALRTDGWWLRSDIIWSKPNPKPESVKDRPTRAHEYVFLLTREPTYFYDSDSIMEQGKEKKRNRRSVWTIPISYFTGAHFAVFPEQLVALCVKAGCPSNGIVLDPFSGSGTTGLVASMLGMNYIGIELNPEYAEMSRNRIAEGMGLFVEDVSE